MDKFINLIFNILAGAIGVILATLILTIIKNFKLKKILPKPSHIDEGRRKGKTAIFFACLIVISIVSWNEIMGPKVFSLLIDKKVETLIHGNKWISYDPIEFDPYLNPNPEIDSIKVELEWVKNAGFNGIITFCSLDNFALIPEIAKKKGLKVIMGIWDPNNVHEIAAAIAKRKYVDAYVVDHNCLGQIYSFNELKKAINKIRFRSRRPVSTTEKVRNYLDDKRLLEIGDWLFPDCHVSIRADEEMSTTMYIADALRDGKNTIKMANMIVKNLNVHKPVLLKMVTYPMNGVTNASLEEQANFFITILESTKDVLSELPSNVSISFHSAFDTPWKREGIFYIWDPYTGLLNEDGSPRPAVHEIIKRIR